MSRKEDRAKRLGQVVTEARELAGERLRQEAALEDALADVAEREEELERVRAKQAKLVKERLQLLREAGEGDMAGS